jgi:hypothetical protein
MLCSEIREILAEEEEVQCHMEPLNLLVCRRSKLLQESLEERMKRAQDNGEWCHLSQTECARLHEQEKRSLKREVDRLRFEKTRTDRMLANLRRLEARAKRIRAAQVASERKRQNSH